MNLFPPIFVAEVKTKSPFGFESKLPRAKLLDLAIQNGDMIAVHTDLRWGGSVSWLKEARGLTKKPILAKGIHPTDTDIQVALDVGADRVLVVGRLPAEKYLDVIWYEPNTIEELAACPKGIKAVWNRRDLTTGQKKDTDILTARSKHNGGWLCQASFIQKPDDVRSSVQAFIVGEHLPEFVKARW